MALNISSRPKLAGWLRNDGNSINQHRSRRPAPGYSLSLLLIGHHFQRVRRVWISFHERVRADIKLLARISVWSRFLSVRSRDCKVPDQALHRRVQLQHRWVSTIQNVENGKIVLLIFWKRSAFIKVNFALKAILFLIGFLLLEILVAKEVYW